MKTLVVVCILAVSAVTAVNTVSVGPEPPTEYNAQWNLIRQGEVRCDRVGQNCYGSNDDAELFYNGDAINLAGYDGVKMDIVYMQDAADDGDYCQLWLAGEHHDYAPFYTFENSEDERHLRLMLDGYYGVRDLGIKFEWVSDESGVARGFRVYSIEITGIRWGEGEYTNIFTWDATSDVTGHQTFDVGEMRYDNMACLSFKYGTDLDTQGWWAIDNVELIADGESVLPMQAGGYGVEDFESGGWYQDQHGLSGEWEIGTDHATGDMSGANWQCDSAARPGWRYEAETFTPWVAISGTTNEVAVDFDTWFHPVGAGESASLGLYGSGYDERNMFFEGFDDLRDWYTFDSGSNVAETSWGAIKAGF